MITKKSNTKPSVKSFQECYDNMCILKRDLYYKDIVKSHSSSIKGKTYFRIKELKFRLERYQISHREFVHGVEALRSGFSCTDVPVIEELKLVTKNLKSTIIKLRESYASGKLNKRAYSQKLLSRLTGHSCTDVHIKKELKSVRSTN